MSKSGCPSMIFDPSDEYMHATPYRGGYIVTDHGEHMGFIKKLKAGWRIEASYRDTSGSWYKACVRAAEFLEGMGK